MNDRYRRPVWVGVFGGVHWHLQYPHLPTTLCDVWVGVKVAYHILAAPHPSPSMIKNRHCPVCWREWQLQCVDDIIRGAGDKHDWTT